MRIHKKDQQISIFLEDMEVLFLQHTFEVISKDYKILPSEAEDFLKKVWFSEDGFETAELTEREELDWNQHLFEFREGYQKQIEAWTKLLSKDCSPMKLEMSLEDIEILIRIMNDRRLYLASCYDKLEGGIEKDFQKIQDPSQKSAIVEFHVLGSMLWQILEEVHGITLE